MTDRTVDFRDTDRRPRYQVQPIGKVLREAGSISIAIDGPFRPALEGLSGFSHAQVIWWFHKFDAEEHRQTLQMDPPFPAPRLGVFALKAPMRPNPIAVSTVKVEAVNMDTGVVQISKIDAFDGTPVLDVKPYMPSFDRVENPSTPEWAKGWPRAMPDDGVDVEQMPGR